MAVFKDDPSVNPSLTSHRQGDGPVERHAVRKRLIGQALQAHTLAEPTTIDMVLAGFDRRQINLELSLRALKLQPRLIKIVKPQVHRMGSTGRDIRPAHRLPIHDRAAIGIPEIDRGNLADRGPVNVSRDIPCHQTPAPLVFSSFALDAEAVPGSTGL